jgi:hypothetical protein
MKRVMLIATVALMLALMGALSGAALAAEGSGGHVYNEEFGITYSGGAGGSDTGSGFGGHESGDLFNLGVIQLNGGSGFGGVGEEGNGGGGGGCEVYFGERYCGGYGFGPN